MIQKNKKFEFLIEPTVWTIIPTGIYSHKERELHLSFLIFCLIIKFYKP